MTRREEVGPHERVEVNLPLATSEALMAFAQSAGLSRTTVIREALADWLSQHSVGPVETGLPVRRKAVA